MSDYNNRDIRDEPASAPQKQSGTQGSGRSPQNQPRQSYQSQNYQSQPPQRSVPSSQPPQRTAYDDEYQRQTRMEEERGRQTMRLAQLRRIQQIIYFIGHAMAIVITFRFVLLALGANRDNQFANFIFDLSGPLVGPFLTLFGQNPVYGSRVFEIPDLIAIAVYYLIAWGLAKVIALVFAPSDASGRAYE